VIVACVGLASLGGFCVVLVSRVSRKLLFRFAGVVPDVKVRFGFAGAVPDVKVRFEFAGVVPDVKVRFRFAGVVPDVGFGSDSLASCQSQSSFCFNKRFALTGGLPQQAFVTAFLEKLFSVRVRWRRARSRCVLL
jgi:hypothetical protein